MTLGKQQVVQYHWSTEMQEMSLEKSEELGLTIYYTVMRSCLFIKQGKTVERF